MKTARAGGMIMSAALLALMMPQSAALVGAHAQTAPGSSLTPESLDKPQ
jgi:hypothetical protein